MDITLAVRLRKATIRDAQAILDLVRELAIYEKAGHEVKTGLIDYQNGLESGLFETILAEHPDHGILGMCLFFPYFSTWGGKTMYLEDFIVKESFRGLGLGRLLFDAYIEESKIQGARKLKWQVLDWNESAKNFYKSYSAKFIAGWENGTIEFDNPDIQAQQAAI